MEIKTENFISDYRGETYNKGCLVPITEEKAENLLKRHTNNGFIIVSQCRNKSIKEMTILIKEKGYSFIPIYGGFIENYGTENEKMVYEKSFIILPCDRKGNTGNLNDLFNFGVELSQKYNQDSFLFQKPGESPKYYNKNGELESELGKNVNFNDFLQQYFTDLYKNTHDKDDMEKSSFLFTECYLNPEPQCYGERYGRDYAGEIFISR